MINCLKFLPSFLLFSLTRCLYIISIISIISIYHCFFSSGRILYISLSSIIFPWLFFIFKERNKEFISSRNSADFSRSLLNATRLRPFSTNRVKESYYNALTSLTITRVDLRKFSTSFDIRCCVSHSKRWSVLLPPTLNLSLYNTERCSCDIATA